MPKKNKTPKELDKEYKALIAKITKLEKAVEIEEGRIDQTDKLYKQAAEEIGRAVESHKERGIKATKLSDVTTLSEVRKILTSTKPLERDITKVVKANKGYVKDAKKVSGEFDALVDACDATLGGTPPLSDKEKREVTALRGNADKWVDRALTRVEAKANACTEAAKAVDGAFEDHADSEVKKTGAEKAARDKRETNAYMADARHVAKRSGMFKTKAKEIDGEAAMVSLAALAGFDLGSPEEASMGTSVKEMTDTLKDMQELFDELNQRWTNDATEADRQYVRDHGAGKKVDAFLASAPGELAKSTKVVSKANQEFIKTYAEAKKKAAEEKKKKK